MKLFGVEFLHPEAFWLMLIIPILLGYYYGFKRKRTSFLFIPGADGLLQNPPKTLRSRIIGLAPILRSLLLACLIVAIARPQSSNSTENINSEGIDIITTVDVSASMLALDFKPNRLEAAKKVAANFVKARINDRIGVVIFSGESFTLCPATTDHNVVLNQIESISSGYLADGTAIGMGLATAVDRLRTSTAKSKVIILLTDGVNNTGLIDPITSTEIAKKYNIRIYTVGVGTFGQAMIPTPQGMMTMDVEIDEPLMKKISKMTGGKYFRATNNTALKNVFAEIDTLEKSKFEVSSFKQKAEVFYPFALLSICFFLLEILLNYVILKKTV